jgi:hypothetical protein
MIDSRTWPKDWNAFFDPAKFYRFKIVFSRTRSLFQTKKYFLLPSHCFHSFQRLPFRIFSTLFAESKVSTKEMERSLAFLREKNF